LQLLKNLQTIRLNRQVWTASLSGLTVAAGLLAISTSSASAQQPTVRYLDLRVQRPDTIQRVSQEEAPESSPLERLKERSAEQRFKKLQNQKTPAPLPLEEPAEIQEVSPADFPPPQAKPVQENKLPRLPELNELKEFAPFEQPAEAKVQPVPQPLPQPKVAPPKLVPAPAPAPLQYSSISQPTAIGMEDRELVRSLSDISPFYNYESPRQREAVLNDNVPASQQNQVPKDIAFPDEELKQRLSPDRLFAWEASNLFHNPLYFEDAPLERNGHSHGDLFLQPLVSLTRMSVQLVGLPYQTVIDSPHTKRYTLGWYRPGEPAPHLHYQIPLNIEAAAAQGLVVTGAAFLVP